MLAKSPDQNIRYDIKSSLKIGLFLLLEEFGFLKVDKDKLYVEIFEQAQKL
jgi:type I restriction enzyme, R subunit